MPQRTPTQLNDDFEAEYEMVPYEAKMSKLLHRADARVKKENPETARIWNESIRILKKGDHYILVLWGVLRPFLRQLKAHFDSVTCSDIIARNYLYYRPRSLLVEPRTTTSRNNTWLGRLLLFLMVTAYAYYGRFTLDF
jgi:hypothetical protein